MATKSTRTSAATSDATATGTRSDRHVIAYLAFTGILLALGIDIALPAFDEMKPALGLAADSNRITLIITVYFFGMGFGQLLWGPVSDRFGRVAALNAGVGLYVIGALASALAPSLDVMLLARIIWGLGAAAPAGLRPAIARDLYSGDRMARVMSMVMAVFMVGPIAAPLLGELILQLGGWQWVFLFCAAAGLVQIVWSRRFGETLDASNRRPLEFRSTLTAFRRVLTTRQTIAYTFSYGFASASFFVFLSSAQPIMDTIYGRADQFALAFAVAGITMSCAFLSLDRLIDRVGARRLAIMAMTVFIPLACVHLFDVIRADGVPSFWTWIGMIITLNLFSAPLGPIAFSLGLEPMGKLAGTASGVIGFLSIMTGSIFAALIDAQITTTVTPMALAYVGYGAISLALLLVAE